MDDDGTEDGTLCNYREFVEAYADKYGELPANLDEDCDCRMCLFETRLNMMTGKVSELDSALPTLRMMAQVALVRSESGLLRKLRWKVAKLLSYDQ